MKIRINDLARELEVKSKQILDVLIKVGVTEKKTHSSSVEADEAEKVRKYFHENSGAPTRHRTGGEEFRPKIDLSKISKPGDALKAILARKEPPVETVAPAASAARAAQGYSQQAQCTPAGSVPVVPERAPRLVTPQSVAMRSQVSTVEMPKPPAAAVPPPPAPRGSCRSARFRPPLSRPRWLPRRRRLPCRRLRWLPNPRLVPADTAPAATVPSDTPAAGRSALRRQSLSPLRYRACQTCRPQAATDWVCPSADAWPTARAACSPHDCAADWAASGLHRSAAATASCAATAFDGESYRSAGTWAADLPASSSWTIVGSCSVHLVLPARVRRCVLASVAPCIRLAPRPLRADVRRWVDVPAWARVRVVRPVRVVCWVLPPVRRLREPRLVLAPA